MSPYIAAPWIRHGLGLPPAARKDRRRDSGGHQGHPHGIYRWDSTFYSDLDQRKKYPYAPCMRYMVTWIPSIYPKCYHMCHTWILWGMEIYINHHKPTIILELNGNMANYMIFECLDQPCYGDYRDLM